MKRKNETAEEYRERIRPRMQEYYRKYYRKHKAEIAEYNRAYRKKLCEGNLCGLCGGEKKTGRYLCDSCDERRRIKTKTQYEKLKSEVFNAYGGVMCACCGEKRMGFLTIDHVGGGGRKHRKELGVVAGGQFYSWLRRNNYPDGFQVLCANCNFSKGHAGYCPHEWEKLYPMIYAEQPIDLTQWKEAVRL